MGGSARLAMVGSGGVGGMRVFGKKMDDPWAGQKKYERGVLLGLTRERVESLCSWEYLSRGKGQDGLSVICM